MKELEKKVFTFIEEQEMIQPGEWIVAGVSGGADSLCLLFLLLEYQKKVPFFLVVCHVNHGIRGEADRDEAYVRALCERKKVPFVVCRKDVPKLAQREGISLEEAGRKARYEAFDEILLSREKEDGSSKSGRIAVAHHLGDSAETLLFHLFRGTGLRGLVGIRPVRDKIIRPLLRTQREEIETYLEEKQISWCIDHTNEEDTYTRNRIRRHILPYAEEKVAKGSTRHIAAVGWEIFELTQYLDVMIEDTALKLCGKTEEGMWVSLEGLGKEHPFLQKQILLWALEKISEGRKNIGRVHLENLCRLTKREGNWRVDLPDGLKICREFDLLKLQKKPLKQIPLVERKLTVPGIYRLKGGQILELSLIERGKVDRKEENQYTKYLDYDKIYNCLTLRSRQQGDYLLTYQEGGRKSLKKYMIEEKIEASLRDRIPVIAEGNHILWVVGYRCSMGYSLDEKTKICLRLKVRDEDSAS